MGTRGDENQVVYVDGDIPQLPLQLGQLLVDSSGISPGNTNLQQCTSQDPLVYEVIQGIPYYPRTAAEIAAGVTPDNYTYPPGHVIRYGALANGSGDSYPAIVAAKAVYAIAGTPIVFDPGVYNVATPVLFDQGGVRVIGIGYITIRYSGVALADYVVAFDGGPLGPNHTNAVFDNFILDGLGNARTGLYVRNYIHRITRNIRCKNTTEHGFLIEGDVLSTYTDCLVSDNEGAFTTIPDNAWTISGSAIISATSACTFINCMAECANVYGWELDKADNNTWIGGTSEGLPAGTGIYSSTDSTGNVFINFFCEVNPVGGDLIEYGKRNKYINCAMTSRAANPPYEGTKSIIVKSGAEQIRFEGMQFYWAEIESGALDTKVQYASGQFVADSGTRSEVLHTRQLFLTAGIIAGPIQRSFTPTFGGSSTDGTITYDVQIGGYIILNGFCEGWLSVRASAVSVAPTGGLLLRGLPATAASGAEYPVAVGNIANITLPASRVQAVAEVVGNTTTLRVLGAATALAASSVDASTLTTNSLISLFFKYPVA